MRFLPAFPCQLIATFLVLISLATSGFTHRFAPVDLSLELQAYVANGGVLADLCGTGNPADAGSRADCKACRLIGTMALPHAVTGLPVPVLGQTQTLRFVAKRLLHTRKPDPSRLTRAPPQV